MFAKIKDLFDMTQAHGVFKPFTNAKHIGKICMRISTEKKTVSNRRFFMFVVECLQTSRDVSDS